MVDLTVSTLSCPPPGGTYPHDSPTYHPLLSYALPVSSLMHSFPCLIPIPSCLFGVPGFVEMLSSHSNHMPPHCLSLCLRWPGVERWERGK
jgi:hypothetical protein